jgi:hypothetical protein
MVSIQKNLPYCFLSCCNSIATEDFLEKQNLNMERPDKELQNLKLLQDECKEWILTVRLLLSELTNGVTFLDGTDESRRKLHDDVTSDYHETTTYNEATDKPMTRTTTIKSERTSSKEEDPSLNVNKVSYEALAQDKNVVKVPLEDINMTKGAEESKDAVYKAFSTIEKLQNELM